MIVYVNGLDVEGVNKKKVEKHKEVGLIVVLVEIKTAPDLVEEKTLQKVEKEDVDQHVQHVKTIQEEKGEEKNELGKNSKEKLWMWTRPM
tara:strand:+ start:272 stop:541 length:270 start_codon:yes stop_codon:yes gene_type:complete